MLRGRLKAKRDPDPTRPRGKNASAEILALKFRHTNLSAPFRRNESLRPDPEKGKSCVGAASDLNSPQYGEILEDMSFDEQEDKTIYKVVVNHEEQYSIWPAHRENALGWRDEGKRGTKSECLAHIKEIWTDMRPLSLRKALEEMKTKA